MWQHVSTAENITWDGRACADITILQHNEEDVEKDNVEEYNADELFSEYEDQNSTKQQYELENKDYDKIDTVKEENKTDFEGDEENLSKIHQEILSLDYQHLWNDTESEIIDSESLNAVIYTEQPEDEEPQEIIAKHRQMDILLDEITLLQNPEVDIFPIAESKSTSKHKTTSTPTKKPKNKIFVQKYENCSLYITPSFLQIMVIIFALHS